MGPSHPVLTSIIFESLSLRTGNSTIALLTTFTYSYHCIMSTQASPVETKPRSCCSGKKTAPQESPIPPNKEVSPIIKIEKGQEEQDKGCQCCSSNTEPVDGTSSTKALLIVALDDGRPQPVVTNFRCACGTFRGCCWGTCYPGCKCPGM